MRFGKFLAAWGQDWIALMSGVASVVLLFWWTLWPPSQDQLRYGLFVVSVLCFVFGSYRIWARENERWRALTEPTQLEALNDLVSEFEALEQWYVGDSKTRPKRLSKLIVKAREQLRHHAPEYVHVFNEAAADSDSRPHFLPTIGRTTQELNEWLKDNERFESWKMASACLEKVKGIRQICLLKLPPSFR
jgi:hypothetical protein